MEKDAEWKRLCEMERAAFKIRNSLMRELMASQARYEPTDLKLIARVEAAEADWQVAKAACERFIKAN